MEFKKERKYNSCTNTRVNIKGLPLAKWSITCKITSSWKSGSKSSSFSVVERFNNVTRIFGKFSLINLNINAKILTRKQHTYFSLHRKIFPDFLESNRWISSSHWHCVLLEENKRESNRRKSPRNISTRGPWYSH
jgi:hypothetical protein